ncbi:MAG: hypothetical protein JJLCMIEE_00172 [Acidimicrobiales bacterium]|nr:MAG: hypothetical protein EDR02_01130 [Actinomycetota bacterium]MBV6507132.1 hypothetical protein [Acidimicrobiales bacterium]RIK05570.1 MAG: hypothetical protein DCC48_09795 [Acidobacteriota bacterium]
MINLRYHIVSITAVFLALGIGVALGATFLDKATVEVLRTQLNGLEESVARTKGENELLKTDLEDLTERTEAFEEEGVARLIEGTLTDVPTMILAVRGTNPSAIEMTQQRLVEAGSDFEGILWVDERLDLDDEQVLAELAEMYADVDDNGSGATAGGEGGSGDGALTITPEEARDRFVTDLAAALLESSEAEPSAQEEVVVLEPGQQLAFAVLNAELGLWAEGGDSLVPGVPSVTFATATDGSGGTTGQGGDAGDEAPPSGEVTEGQAFVKLLRQLRLLEYESPAAAEQPSAVLPPPGVRWVFVSGPGAVVPNESFMYPLIEEMVAAGPASLVVAEALPEVDEETETPAEEDTERGTFVDPLRANAAFANRLSTLDNLDDDLGRVAAVLTVEDLAIPLFGNYGEAASANRLFPPA